MGSGCDQNPNQPNYTNPCTESDSVGQILTIPGLCTTVDSGPAECSRIGSGWVYLDSKPCPCYDSEIVCQRVRFTGDQRTCCLQDYNSLPTRDRCFSDSEQRNTCAPENRGPTQSGCRNYFSQVCIDGPIDKAYQTWTASDDFCRRTLEGNLSDLNWVQGEIRTLLNRAFVNGIAPVGRADPFQAYLYQLCLDYPAACQTGLNDVCSQYSRESVDNQIINFCGCHMIPSVYGLYANLYGISKECDPICARSSSIPYVNTDGIVQQCNSTICIIDDVTLNLTESTVGNINFTQACGGCNVAASCNCTITGVNIQQVESDLGDINLSQYCTGSLTCYKNSPDGTAVKVDCYTEEPISESVNNTSQKVGIILVVVIAVLLILGLILLLASAKK